MQNPDFEKSGPFYANFDVLGEIKCKCCEKKYEIEWYTDCGCPLFGNHFFTCYCGEKVYFNCEVVYTQN